MIARRAALLTALALAGCASPEPTFFTLAPRPATTTPGTTVPGGPRLVEMRRIGLAGYLDRPEIVRRSTDYRLSVAGTERWGEPLGALVARVLAENLNMRLPGSSVFTASGAISADPDATVELDLQRFDLDVTGEVVLLAQVAVSRGRTRIADARTIRLAVTPAGPTTTDLVAAMSTALGQLADQIAAMLRR